MKKPVRDRVLAEVTKKVGDLICRGGSRTAPTRPGAGVTNGIEREIEGGGSRTAPTGSVAGDDISLYKLPVTGDRLFGRERELKLLDEAWADSHTRIVTLVAWGGVGKTALVNRWLNELQKENYRGALKVYGWSFYSQGAAEGKQASADEFFQETLEWFGDPHPEAGSAVDKGRRLVRLVGRQKALLILDGLEPLQYPPGEVTG